MSQQHQVLEAVALAQWPALVPGIISAGWWGKMAAQAFTECEAVPLTRKKEKEPEDVYGSRG